MVKVPEQTSTFIWDLDGTLIDSFGVFEAVLSEVLPGYNRELPSREIMLQNYHGSLEDSISAVLGGVSGQELSEIVQDFVRAQNPHYADIDSHVFPDALRLAMRASEAGVTQIVVTNRAHEGRMNASPRYIVQNSELRSLIDVVISGDDGEHRKPKPEVLGSQKIVPENTLVIGDQFVDGEFARNLGVRAVLVARGAEIPHLERLGDSWQNHITAVQSLDEVHL